MTEKKRIIKVLIVDDHQIVRDGIRSLLKDNSDYEVIGEAKNGEEALIVIKSRQPDIVIMDINMPVMNGIECTKIIMEEYDRIRVLVLSMHNEDIYLRKMLEAGASGYILKSSGKDEMLKALERIVTGHLYFSEAVTMSFMSELGKETDNNDKLNIPLTEREIEVLELIIQEHTNQEIAEKLFISIRTVDSHRRNLIEKTGSRNIAGLVKFAIENKLFNY